MEHGEWTAYLERTFDHPGPQTQRQYMRLYQQCRWCVGKTVTDWWAGLKRRQLRVLAAAGEEYWQQVHEMLDQRLRCLAAKTPEPFRALTSRVRCRIRSGRCDCLCGQSPNATRVEAEMDKKARPQSEPAVPHQQEGRKAGRRI